MLNQPLFALHSSFIICTQNRSDDLLACVRSIAAQDCLPTELIIIDASDPASVAQNNHAAVREMVKGTLIRFEYQLTARANLPFQRNRSLESGDQSRA